MVYVQLRTINDRQRDADLRVTQQEIYQAAISTYSQDVANFKLCLDSVTRSDANRGQWVALVEVIRGLGGAEADAFADSLTAGPLLSSEPRKASDCTDPGPPPKAPE
jgi:hypothetical protein